MVEHSLTDLIHPLRIETIQLPVVTTQAVQPALEWEFIGQLYALMPIIVLVMVFMLLRQLFKPEVLKEVVPVVKEIAIAKAVKV